MKTIMEATEKEIKALKIISECKSTLGIRPSNFGFILIIRSNNI